MATDKTNFQIFLPLFFPIPDYLTHNLFSINILEGTDFHYYIFELFFRNPISKPQ